MYMADYRVLWFPRECVHIIDYKTTNAIGSYISQQLEGAKLAIGDGGHQYSGPTWLQQLYNGGNMTIDSIDRFVDGIASSVASFIRVSNNDVWFDRGTYAPEEGVDRAVPGYELYGHTCIRVRWKFLSFPAILLLAELVFFVIVIATNRYSVWDGDWKSSNVPLMFQDIDLPSTANGEKWDMGDEKQLRDVAKSIQVKLIQDNDRDGRWRLATEA